ncbi:hypothetical protein Bhyg_17838, partial [Pseudolycoriella hygida]
MKAVLFKKNVSKLFDIALCKCKDSCTCTCNLTVNLRHFLMNQRTNRKLKIQHIKPTSSASVSATAVSASSQDCQMYDDTDSYRSSTEDCDENDDHHWTTRPITSQYNTLNARPVAEVADRYGVSSQATAAIASATLQMVGLVTVGVDDDLVMNRCKVQRAKATLRQESSAEKFDNIMALFFDGRKDTTMFMKAGADLIQRQSFRKEEHISLIKEPGAKYIGHLSLTNSKAPTISNGIFPFINQSLCAVGCDGTKTNTGPKGGVIRLLEVRLKKPLQWLICQLHFVELPLRALFVFIDGKTLGPHQFSGEIGSKLGDCVNLPIVKFERVTTKLPNLTNDMQIKDLSTDQKYLYEICEAISTGIFSQSLSERRCGNLCHSRWLTLANSVLRLYVGTRTPSKNLKTLVHFIMKSYAPSWFSIKIFNKCCDGSKNLFEFIKSTRFLDEKYKVVVEASIQRNGFFGHPENILLNMISDSRLHVREMAYKRITDSRRRTETARVIGVRKFTIPSIQFNATDYYDIIDWKRIEVTEPPLFKTFSDEQLLLLVKDGRKAGT